MVEMEGCAEGRGSDLGMSCDREHLIGVAANECGACDVMTHDIV